MIDADLELSGFDSGSMSFSSAERAGLGERCDAAISPHVLTGGDPCMGKDVPPIELCVVAGMPSKAPLPAGT